MTPDGERGGWPRIRGGQVEWRDSDFPRGDLQQRDSN